MTDPAAAPATATITGRNALAVTASTLAAAASGYAILVVATHTLTPEDYIRYQVFWALYFAVLGVLFGLQQETTRAASAGAAAPRPTPDRRVGLVRTSLAIGLGAGVLVALTAPAWAPTLLPRHTVAMAAVVAVAAVLYAGQTGLLGTLGGRRRWGTFAAVITAEATVRLVAVALAAVVGWGLLGFAVATGVAAATWLALLPARDSRAAIHERGDTATGPFVRRSGQAMLAAAASAILVMGFPALLELTTPGNLGEPGARLVLAVILTRAPLMLPMNAFQGVAINHFVRQGDRGLAALGAPAVAVAGLGAVTAGLAWLVGDPVITWVFGAAYHNPPAVLAALAGAATLVAALTLTGAAVLAADRHRAYVTGWVGATLVATAALLLPGSLVARTLTSLVVGPLVGIAVHLAVLARAGRWAPRPNARA